MRPCGTRGYHREARGDEVGDEGRATGDAVFGVGTIRLRDGESMVDDAAR